MSEKCRGQNHLFSKIHLDRLLLVWVAVQEMNWALWCDSLFVMRCVHHRHKCWAQGVFGLCWPCRLPPHNVLSHSVFLSCFAQNDKEQLCWIRGCFRKEKEMERKRGCILNKCGSARVRGVAPFSQKSWNHSCVTEGVSVHRCVHIYGFICNVCMRAFAFCVFACSLKVNIKSELTLLFDAHSLSYCV